MYRKPHRRYLMGIATCVVLLAGLSASGAPTAKDVFPDEADPFVGDWSGRWTKGETVDPEAHAQIIALGGDRYRIILLAKFNLRAPPKLVIEVEKQNGALAFKRGSFSGEFRGDRFTGSRDEGKGLIELKKVTRLSPRMGAEPPDGAIVLFDGTSFDEWRSSEGWSLVDGNAMMVAAKGGKTLTSKRAFQDLDMHIEFRTPFMPKARGQSRGNSGVFVQDIYEIQVLDSYGLPGYYDECGALYKLSAPRVNACAPPLQWQTYDIQYRAPRHDAAGKLTENGRLTVIHNGVLIQDDVELLWKTDWTEKGRLSAPPKAPGRIKLQSHGNFVQYRNIWVVDRGGAN